MNDELVKYLEGIAKQKAWNDDPEFTSYDYCGGNFDDAFYGGCTAGEIRLARELLERFKK